MDLISHGTLHHVELWVPDLDRAAASWGWLLGELGYELFQDWSDGKSWRSGPTYIVVEQSSARIATRHDRCRPGLNHLAFHVENRVWVDKLAAEAPQHGWRLMFADQHPFAGGDSHYAAYMENIDGFEAELVAPPEPPAPPQAAPQPPAPPPSAPPSPAGTPPVIDAPPTSNAPPTNEAPLASGIPPASEASSPDQGPPAGSA